MTMSVSFGKFASDFITVIMTFNEKFEKDDYYFSDEGYIVFTEKYHLKRGYCCQNSCRHCPYKKNDAKKKFDNE